MDILEELIKNWIIWDKVKMTSVVDKTGKVKLRWFKHAKKRCGYALIKRHER